MDPFNPKPYIDMLVELVRAATPLVRRVGLKKKQRKAFAELLAASNDIDQQAALARQIEELAALAPNDPMSHVLTRGTKKLYSAKKPAAKKAGPKNARPAKGSPYSAAKAFKSATKATGKKAAAKKPAAGKRVAK